LRVRGDSVSAPGGGKLGALDYLQSVRNGKRGLLRQAAQFIGWLLPPIGIKNALLRWCGHDVSRTARIMPTIVVGVANVHVGEHVRIGLLNVLRDLSNVWLDDYSLVESWNWVSAHPTYQASDADCGTLFLGVRAKLGSRNYVDCSGTIIVRSFGTVGGQRCLLHTHEPDFRNDRQTVGRITVGRHAYVGSGAVLLKGAEVPDRSIVAAHSTMTAKSAQNGVPGLYAGTPATWKRATSGDWFERNTYVMTGYVVEQQMGVLPEDRDATGQVEVVDGPA
jgi:acetyltransferase-like isoleucine patch superfamily enzyme